MASGMLDVLLICQDEALEPSQKMVFAKRQEEERKHQEDVKKYQEALAQFYSSVGVNYNKRNGETTPKELQMGHANEGVTRVVSTVPVTQSSLIHPEKKLLNGHVNPTILRTSSVTVTTKALPKDVTPIITNVFNGIRSTANTSTSVIPKPTVQYRPPVVSMAPSVVQTNPEVVLMKSSMPTGQVMHKEPRALPYPAYQPKQSLQNAFLPLVTNVPVAHLPQSQAKVDANNRKRTLEPDNFQAKKKQLPSLKKVEVETPFSEDKHYGFKKGNRMAEQPCDRKFRIKCFHCDNVFPNNIQYMQHVINFLEQGRKASRDSNLHCMSCFKKFRTALDMESHMDRYHSLTSRYFCKICDYSFRTLPTLKTHLQGVHEPLSMPYVCKCCTYRTSFHQDLVKHFSEKHKGDKALMCFICCKVLKDSRSFMTHCQRHYSTLSRPGGSYNCPCCKLIFLSTSERNEHVHNDHKRFLLLDKDGIPPYTPIQHKPPNIITPAPKPVKTPEPVRNVSSTPSFSSKPSTSSFPIARSNSLPKYTKSYECLECGGTHSDFVSHLSTEMHCASCRYVTFCGSAFAQHMIAFHSTYRDPPKVHPVRKSFRRGEITLFCKKCWFKTSDAPKMAWHTATCPKGSSTIESFMYLKTRNDKMNYSSEKIDTSKEVIEID